MPIEEYKKEKCTADHNVNIKVVSLQCDAAGAGLFGMTPEDVARGCADKVEENCGDCGEYTMTCTGNLDIADGRISLRYSEPPVDGEDGCDTEISYSVDDPGCVTVTRSGGVSASFVLRERSRNISVYSTPFGPIEMCVWARRVSNTMTQDGGTISMDYTVELKGLTAQRTRITVSAEMIK